MNYSEILEGIGRLEEAVRKLWARANILEARKKSGEARLAKYPLWVRLVKFYRFSKIRAIIKRRAMERSFNVVLTLSLNKKLSVLKRKYNV